MYAFRAGIAARTARTATTATTTADAATTIPVWSGVHHDALVDAAAGVGEGAVWLVAPPPEPVAELDPDPEPLAPVADVVSDAHKVPENPG